MTEQDMRSIFQSLQEISPELNAATDDVNNAIAAVEAFLDECSIGIPAEVCMDEVQVDDERRREKWIEYRRFNAGFCLVVTESTVLDPGGTLAEQREETSAVALASAPRATKLEAFPLIPELLERIVKNARVSIASAKKTAPVVAEIISSMKTAKP